MNKLFKAFLIIIVLPIYLFIHFISILVEGDKRR